MKDPTTDNTAERVAQLHSDVENLVSSDDWRRMLEVASRFHTYSANNVFLIMLQRPDASQVAGYRTWQSVGRQVRKGEKGISILAPIVRKITVTDEETGEDVTLQSLASFRVVHVFDVSQTDGDPIPEVQRPILLDGDAPSGLWESLSGMVRDRGYEVQVCWSDEANAQLLGQANGSTRHDQHLVTIRYGLSDAQRCKTLAHELAHVLLHPSLAEYSRDRERCEVEAESVAFVVCNSVGLVTGEYTIPYVATWSGGDLKMVSQTAERVLKAAREILASVDREPELV